MTPGFLDSLPIGVIWIGVAVLILCACEVGFRFGQVHFRKHQDSAAQGAVGPMVGGLLGTLGFVLAFTFSLAAGQHAERKKNVLNEANAISDAYLRADLLEATSRDEVKGLLREYVDIRLSVAAGADFNAALARSLVIQRSLWDAVSASARSAPSANKSINVQSINQVIDMHEQRITGALHTRIPASIWVALAAIVALTMGTMGLQVGLAGKRRMIAVIPLSLSFAVLLTLIVDLNRPRGSLVTIGQQAMIDVQQRMRDAIPDQAQGDP